MIVEVDEWAILVKGPISETIFPDLDVTMERLVPLAVFLGDKCWHRKCASKNKILMNF